MNRSISGNWSHLLVCIFAALMPATSAAEPFAYIGNAVDDTVSVVDTATNTVVDTLTGIDAFAVEVHPDGSTVYITNTITGGARVAVIDTATQAITADILVGSTPTGMAITPDGTRLFVASTLLLACQFGGVSVIDTTTNTVIDDILFVGSACWRRLLPMRLPGTARLPGST